MHPRLWRLGAAAIDSPETPCLARSQVAQLRVPMAQFKGESQPRVPDGRGTPDGGNGSPNSYRWDREVGGGEAV
jgi:hypothetical protein